MKDEKMEALKRAIVQKACLKQDVYAVTKEVFSELKAVLQDVTSEIHDFITPSDTRVIVELKTMGAFESKMTLAGDTIIFSYAHKCLFLS